MSLSQQAMMRMAELALENGIKHAETAGALNRYLDGLYLQHGTANNTRIYGEIVFIFHGSKLITVYPLPGEFKRTAAKIRSRKKGATV
jgi:hypothetical protein